MSQVRYTFKVLDLPQNPLIRVLGGGGGDKSPNVRLKILKFIEVNNLAIRAKARKSLKTF